MKIEPMSTKDFQWKQKRAHSFTFIGRFLADDGLETWAKVAVAKEWPRQEPFIDTGKQVEVIEPVTGMIFNLRAFWPSTGVVRGSEQTPRTYLRLLLEMYRPGWPACMSSEEQQKLDSLLSSIKWTMSNPYIRYSAAEEFRTCLERQRGKGYKRPLPCWKVPVETERRLAEYLMWNSI